MVGKKGDFVEKEKKIAKELIRILLKSYGVNSEIILRISNEIFLF